MYTLFIDTHDEVITVSLVNESNVFTKEQASFHKHAVYLVPMIRSILSESKEDIGISEYFNKGGVTIIEWADLISDILPKDRLDIRIKIVDENKRVFYITPHGEEYEDLCERVL